MAVGPRGLLAFWIGGASNPPPPPGVRGLLAFWIGGASGIAETPPPSAVGETGAGMTPRRRVRRMPLSSPLEEFDAAEEEIELRLMGVLR